MNQKATVPTAHSRAEESGQTEQPALELGAAKSGRGPPGGAADTDVGHLPRTIQKTDMLHLPFASGGNLKPKRGRRGKLSEPWGLYKTAEAAHEGLWSRASLTRKQTKKPNQHPHKKKKKKENLLPLAGENISKSHPPCETLARVARGTSDGTAGGLGL